ncbi:transcriptional regulator, LysR family, partial [Hungatella hathewayi DSM 13479]
MNTTYFKDFLTIAELGSYEKAAEELYTTQSTLTKHIQKLESELGTTLFDRTSRSVRLNECGKIFLPYA